MSHRRVGLGPRGRGYCLTISTFLAEDSIWSGGTVTLCHRVMIAKCTGGNCNGPHISLFQDGQMISEGEVKGTI